LLKYGAVEREPNKKLYGSAILQKHTGERMNKKHAFSNNVMYSVYAIGWVDF
jgi:hypothetical protein